MEAVVDIRIELVRKPIVNPIVLLTPFSFLIASSLTFLIFILILGLAIAEFIIPPVLVVLSLAKDLVLVLSSLLEVASLIIDLLL